MSRNREISVRAQEKTRRVLQLIDALAPFRSPKRLEEIRRLMIDRTGIIWHDRTIHRDLLLLEELGFVERVRPDKYKDGSRWVLKLRETERLQCAVCVLMDQGEPIKAHIVKFQDRGRRPVYHREALTKTMADTLAATLRKAGMRASVEVVRIRCGAAVG